MGNIDIFHGSWATLVYVCRWYHNDTAVAIISLSTTAIVALVASGALPLPAAIAAVLGANIAQQANLAGRFVCVRWYA